MGKILLWFILVFLIVSMIFTFTLSGCKDWRNFGKDAGKDAGPGEIDAGPGEIDAGK